ncbi:hypothetical protein C8Q69DRAFT_459397 [Paecilomyces variotii]|uniref:Uncharacterized protein n=1 Tax=Byssochlamys spectabilis TaxID=264951 RepID=A0A443I3B5_BYSSP|nr:hypothetical protein C8Q69DRAFT_459397 [Paecilomyces variotii]RWQ98574.1 hypothetical protein C8Q69DRAFT_459397 [Paecilomyces variotii]
MTAFIFSGNCTIPANITHYVSGPNTRGTLDIIWSSLSILILCVWSIQHLNLPPQWHLNLEAYYSSSEEKGKKKTPTTRRIYKMNKKIRRKGYLLNREIRWMIMNLVAPEFLLAKALTDFVSARSLSPRLKAYASEDEVDWDMAHTYYANMGGFIVRFEKDEGQLWVERGDGGGSQEDVESCRVSREHGISNSMTDQESLVGGEEENHDTMKIPTPVTSVQNMQNAIHGLMQSPAWSPNRYIERVYEFQGLTGFDWEVDSKNREAVLTALEEYPTSDMHHISLMRWYHNVCALQGNVWYLDAAQLLLVRQCGIITSLPHLPKEVLDDQSKSDSLAKTFTLIQVVWLALQLISRQTEGLPSSQMEISALSFAVCSFFTYLLMWNKPQGVEASCYITANRRPTVQEVKALGIIGPATFGPHRMRPWISNNCFHPCYRWDHAASSLRPSDFEGDLKRISRFQPGFVVGAVLFGGIHCLSWNSHFPTSAEHLLWRASCLLLTIVPPVGGMCTFLMGWIRSRLHRIGRTRATGYIANLMSLVLTLPYILTRLYLNIEVFRCLAYEPPEVFLATNWPDWLPHLG